MMRSVISALLVVSVLAVSALGAACRHSPGPTVAAASNVATAPPSSAPPAMNGTMPHGDHNPHHGGIVYMYDDLHYEVVLDARGHHRVYFTDSAREDLPASVASDVTLTVEGAEHQREKLTGTIDAQGESWVFEGQPVGGADTSVRVAFVARGDQYWIDVPFIPSGQ
jgi:hypothetical protein